MDPSSFLTRNRTRFILILLMALAAVASAVLFMPQSLRLDEAQTLWQVSRFPPEILSTIGGDVHVPLYHFLLYAWDIFFGNGLADNRIFSMVFFIASIPMVVLVGDEAYGNRVVGVFAAVLLAVSPFMNWYANEIRMYSMLVFVTLANQLFFIRLRKYGRRGTWWAYAATSVIGVYIHYFFALVLLAQAFFFLFFRRSFPRGSTKRFAVTYLAVVLALVPWIVYVLRLGKAVNSEPLLAMPTLINLFNTFSEFLVGGQSVPINAFVVALWPLVLIIWFLTFQKRRHPGTDHVYLVYSLFVPIITAFLVSVLYKPVYLERYLIFTLPAFYLLLSAMIAAYPPKLANLLRAAFVIAMLFALYALAMNPATPVVENYAVAADYFRKYATPQDVIAVSAPFTIYPVEYYYQGPTAVHTLPLWDQAAKGPIPPFVTSTFPSEVAQVAGDHTRLWLLLSYNQGYEQTVQSYFDSHYERLAKYTLSPDMTLELYKLRYDVSSTAEIPPPPPKQLLAL